MTFVVTHIKWLMLMAGVLTCTMATAAVAPQAALRSSFGEGLDGPVADVVVRNWGALIALVGAMLIAGAFHAPSRPMALVVAGVSKATFIALVLAHGPRFLGHQAGLAVAVDAVWVGLFALYGVAVRR